MGTKVQEEEKRVHALLKDTVMLLCRNGIDYRHDLKIQGLLGITVDCDRVLLVQLDELFNEKEHAEKNKEGGDEATSSRKRRRRNGSQQGDASETINLDDDGPDVSIVEPDIAIVREEPSPAKARRLAQQQRAQQQARPQLPQPPHINIRPTNMQQQPQHPYRHQHPPYPRSRLPPPLRMSMPGQRQRNPNQQVRNYPPRLTHHQQMQHQQQQLHQQQQQQQYQQMQQQRPLMHVQPGPEQQQQHQLFFQQQNNQQQQQQPNMQQPSASQAPATSGHAQPLQQLEHIVLSADSGQIESVTAIPLVPETSGATTAPSGGNQDTSPGGATVLVPTLGLGDQLQISNSYSLVSTPDDGATGGSPYPITSPQPGPGSAPTSVTAGSPQVAALGSPQVAALGSPQVSLGSPQVAALGSPHVGGSSGGAGSPQVGQRSSPQISPDPLQSGTMVTGASNVATTTSTSAAMPTLLHLPNTNTNTPPPFTAPSPAYNTRNSANERKERNLLSLHDKVRMIKEAESGKKSQHDLQIQFDVSASVVNQTLKQRDRLLAMFGESARSSESGARNSESPNGGGSTAVKSVDGQEFEKKLADWCRQEAQTKAVTNQMIQDKGLELATASGYDSFVASPSWVASFRKRHNLA